MNYLDCTNGEDLYESVYANRELTDDLIDDLLYSTTWEEPSNYKNMQEGYELLMDTIKKGGEIAVLVDTDCDGIASASLMMLFIMDELHYDKVGYIIRDKVKKTHGLRDAENEVMDNCIKNRYSLLICPDSASNDFKEHKQLHELGTDILILDHHIYDTGHKTDAVIINNKDGQVENVDLSGTGVTYKFAYYVAEKEGIDIKNKYLDLVAMSIISDMCSTRSKENRFLYNMGRNKKNVSNKMLKSFVKNLDKGEYIGFEDYAFGINNKINAIIRMASKGEMEDTMESFINSIEEVQYKYRGKTITQSIQDSIIRLANRCQSKQKRMIEKAIKEGINILTTQDDKILIVETKNVASTIRGMLANRLAGEYNKPVFMLTKTCDGVYRGSARGVGDVMLKDICDSSNMFSFCQGHTNAFGCNINEENIKDFISYANKELLGVDFTNKTPIDFIFEEKIPYDEIEFLNSDIENLWTGDIKRPNILVKNIIINSGDIKKNGINLSFRIEDLEYKKFFCSKVFYEDLIKIEENEDIDKDLSLSLIVEIKQHNNRLFANIVDYESQVIS